MAHAPERTESWKRMVLRSMPRPAWLSPDAPHGDVVLSTRTRFMRNLRGHCFPHRCDPSELRDTMVAVLEAAKAADLGFDAHKALTNAERDHLVGCRLVSPDFEWTLPGRAFLLDPARAIGLMVNEEDHLRLQALTAGWSLEPSHRLAQDCLDALASRLPFAWSPRYGYLSASPFNLGEGRRHSAMFHLIGLAHGKRLPGVMKALAAKGITVRGLFGESSRAVGAFVQVSVIGRARNDFVGACEYLLREEREARAAVDRDALSRRAASAREHAVVSPSVTLADALRVLAWLRWAASAELPGFALAPRQMDEALTRLEIRSTLREEDAAQARADFLRSVIGG